MTPEEILEGYVSILKYEVPCPLIGHGIHPENQSCTQCVNGLMTETRDVLFIDIIRALRTVL